MLIDLVDIKGNQLLKYESNIIPRVGEEITHLYYVGKSISWRVASVNYLLSGSDTINLDLVTITVIRL